MWIKRETYENFNNTIDTYKEEVADIRHGMYVLECDLAKQSKKDLADRCCGVQVVDSDSNTKVYKYAVDWNTSSSGRSVYIFDSRGITMAEYMCANIRCVCFVNAHK